jgi:peptidoglycan hydrolase-like protein with peptidoglycan-binding domain
LDLSGGGLALTGLETTSILSLPSPALLAQTLATELPDLGAIHATAELSWKEDWITLGSFTAQTESFGQSRLRAEGRIGKFLNNKLDLDPQLDLSASIEKSRQLVSLFAELSDETGPPVKGSDDHLVLSIQRGLKSLGLHPGPADGKMGPHTRAAIEVFQAKHGLTVNGRATEQLLHDLQQERDSPRQRAARNPDDLRPQTSKLEDSMPELGPVRARAALRDRGGLLALTGIDVSAGPPDEPAVHVTGKIGDLLAIKQVDLKGNFELEIASLLGPDAAIKESELGKLRGELDLSDADGSLGIESLHAEAIDTKLLTFSLAGKFDDITQRDDLRFETSLKAPSLSALGRELGFEAGRLGVFTFTGHVSGSDEKLLAEGKARLGQTDFSGTLSGSLVGERPALSGKLYSPVLHFADFGLLPETDAEKVDQETEKAQQGLFSDDPIPFEILKAFDLNLDVLLDQLEGVELDIDKAEAQLNLKDGVLKIEPLRFVFVGGRLAAHLVADAQAKDPEISLRLEADDVDLGDLLAQVRVDVPLDGELDMVLDLKAAGASPRALASSLEGDWDMAVSRGHVRTGLLDLAAVDLVDWMTSDSAWKGYSDLNCFVLRIDYHEGLGEIERLLLDTTNVLATGEGDINLRQETIDIKVEPHTKKFRLIKLTSPFAIEGPLASPSVKLEGGNAGMALRMIGEILLAPIHLLGSLLLPLVHDHGKDAHNPCLVLGDGPRVR